MIARRTVKKCVARGRRRSYDACLQGSNTQWVTSIQPTVKLELSTVFTPSSKAQVAITARELLHQHQHQPPGGTLNWLPGKGALRCAGAHWAAGFVVASLTVTELSNMLQVNANTVSNAK